MYQLKQDIHRSVADGVVVNVASPSAPTLHVGSGTMVLSADIQDFGQVNEFYVALAVDQPMSEYLLVSYDFMVHGAFGTAQPFFLTGSTISTDDVQSLETGVNSVPLTFDVITDDALRSRGSFLIPALGLIENEQQYALLHFKCDPNGSGVTGLSFQFTSYVNEKSFAQPTK